MATKRNLRNSQEIRELIETSGLPYIMVNNRIFEEFYEHGKATYRPLSKTDKKTGEITYFLMDGKEVEFSKSEDKHEINFNDRDIILFILLTFLDQIDFQGYRKEVADYLGYSEKRLKERLNKLRFIQGNTVSRKYDGKREYFNEPTPRRFITEQKVKGYEVGKQVTLNRWYVNYECDYKQEVDKDGNTIDKPENFFIVTIYDLDLLTSGQLNEKEFITYLYLIKSYNSGKEDAIYQSITTISEKVNIKDRDITKRILSKLVDMRVKDKFCNDEHIDFPLVHYATPKNYTDKLTKRLEPSLKYYPIYNSTTLQKLREEKVDPYPENKDEKYMDSDQTKTDTNLLVDSDSANMDTGYDIFGH